MSDPVPFLSSYDPVCDSRSMSGHIIAAKGRACNPSGSEKRAPGDCEAAVKAESVLNAVLGKAIINRTDG